MKLSELNIGKVIKDGEFDWLGLTAEEYGNKKILTFLADIKYFEEVKNNNTITCIITTEEIANNIKDNKYGLIISENPKRDFFELHNKLVDEEFYFKKEKNNISSKAIISPRASIREYNINIEDDVVIEENVVIYPNVTIKKDSIIKAGTILGADGFQYFKSENNNIQVKPIGKLIIEEDVTIHNNCVIDRGIFDKTIIDKNTKIYNLVHIAHDSKIEKNTLITAGVIVCGRVRIGENSYLGPNCTIKNGLKLGKNSKVSMGAVVTKNVQDNEVVTGNFAISHQKFLKLLKYLLDKIKE
ncbi:MULTISPECIES: DapH/DapD/GlmU-related protein [Fusobacterium]|uniref:DapH/DapD/GlmU-related protein n=1 Tax=Fusobacterium TaxID=848 RepID=UPI001476C5F4|nr:MULTISPECIES: DapH/DapD/GlmU-related protein [Fusobacterium]NME35808.1 UDP-3-O-(3-hydroxymyristoyl)glucosamine N-acyltransferase [Fusobacterium sp. FSA-380-WT-3A]